MGPSLLRAREPQQLGCWGVRALGGLGLPAAVRGLGRACSRCGSGSFPWPPASLARPSLRRPGPLGWVVLGLRAVAVPLVRLAASACGLVRSEGVPPGVLRGCLCWRWRACWFGWLFGFAGLVGLVWGVPAPLSAFPSGVLHPFAAPPPTPFPLGGALACAACFTFLFLFVSPLSADSSRVSRSLALP